jgi:hypothetical protein
MMQSVYASAPDFPWILKFIFGWGKLWLMILDDLTLVGLVGVACWWLSSPKGWWPFRRGGSK